MNPILEEPEILEIIPYEHRPFKVGDVVLFLPSDFSQPVVHRIMSVSLTGVKTRGDNNTCEDSFLLNSKNIKGQVIAAWRGQKRRKIAGGLKGLLLSRWLRWIGLMGRGVSRLIHPLYHALSRSGFLAFVMPEFLRPRIFIFNKQGREQLLLLIRQRVIGRYDELKYQWQIKRPFKLFVNISELPVPKNKKYSKSNIEI